MNKDVMERIEKLENEIKILRTKSICEEYMVRSLQVKKTPHKCPVCNGCGYSLTGASHLPDESFKRTHYPCHVCEGRGILWG